MDSKVTTRHNALERIMLDENAEPMDLPLSLLEDITKCFSGDLQIGSGGFAVVYKGMVGSGMVAVKKLSKTFDHMHEDKFHKEIECLMKAKHKNIVRFLGYCSDTQGKITDYEGKLVMADVRNWLLCFEYVPNGSLDKYITEVSRGLEWRERYKIIKGICEGLSHLHEKRILHLDLKPANILIHDHMVPKIADFGLSRCLSKEQTRTFTSHLCGSLGYLAPEFFRGEITFASDIYSLGVIIVELLTGQKGHPEDENVAELWMNRLMASDQRDTQLEQVRVCTKIGTECMDSDPKKRPTARHIVDRLDKTASADYSEETVISSSSAERQIQEVVTKFPKKNKEVVTKVPRRKEVVDQNQLPRYKLRFMNDCCNIFTHMKIRAPNGDPLKICMEDNNGQRNRPRRLLSAMIKIVVLYSSFNEDNKVCWTSEDFRRNIVRPRDEVKEILTGELELRLENGEANICTATFTDNSRFTRTGKFRLGVMVVDELGERVQEGITEPFRVREKPRQGYEKHDSPSFDDDVCRLKRITEGGNLCQALNMSGIFCVQDFLRSYYKDENALRQILKEATEGRWTSIIDHAKMCDPGNELYSFDVEGRDVVLFFDSFYRIVGVTSGDQYTPFTDLDTLMQDQVREWSRVAYDTLADRQPDYETRKMPHALQRKSLQKLHCLNKSGEREDGTS